MIDISGRDQLVIFPNLPPSVDWGTLGHFINHHWYSGRGDEKSPRKPRPKSWKWNCGGPRPGGDGPHGDQHDHGGDDGRRSGRCLHNLLDNFWGKLYSKYSVQQIYFKHWICLQLEVSKLKLIWFGIDEVNISVCPKTWTSQLLIVVFFVVDNFHMFSCLKLEKLLKIFWNIWIAKYKIQTVNNEICNI